MNQQEIDRTVELLKKLEPGVLPTEIFYQFARLYVTPIIELVPLRKDVNSDIKILTLKRPEDDPSWPGQFHTPGTVLRATDKSIDEALDRILRDELENLELVDKPIFVNFDFHKVARGTEIALVFSAEYTERPNFGEEIDANNLPMIW